MLNSAPDGEVTAVVGPIPLFPLTRINSFCAPGVMFGALLSVVWLLVSIDSASAKVSRGLASALMMSKNREEPEAPLVDTVVVEALFAARPFEYHINLAVPMLVQFPPSLSAMAVQAESNDVRTRRFPSTGVCSVQLAGITLLEKCRTLFIQMTPLPIAGAGFPALAAFRATATQL